MISTSTTWPLKQPQEVYHRRVDELLPPEFAEADDKARPVFLDEDELDKNEPLA